MEVTISPPSPRNNEQGISAKKWIITVMDGVHSMQFTTLEEPTEGVIYTCRALARREWGA